MATPRMHDVLVVGAGGIGPRHVEALGLTGRARISICEPNRERRTQVAGSLPVQRTFEKLDDALQERWDAAVVATPAHMHLAVGRRITDAGSPLLLEKPLAVTAEGIAAWIRETEERKIPVMVGYVFRCHPLLIALRRELLAGRIGEPVQLVVQRGAHLPSRRPDYTTTYYSRREQGGGVVHDILSHLYNAAEWLVGPIARLSADAAHCCLPGVEVEDTVNVIARHGSVLASYSQNQHQFVGEFSLTINGTRGSLRASFHQNRLETAIVPDGKWTAQDFPALSPLEWFRLQADTFLDVVEGKSAPPCGLPEGLVTLNAILATFRSIAGDGAAVKVASGT